MRIVERKLELKHIDGRLTIGTLKDIVLLDEKLIPGDTIILNSRDYDDFAREFRRVRGIDMGFPMFYGILIKERKYEIIPYNKIGILRKENEVLYEDIIIDEFNSCDNKTVYRCCRCGCFVEEDGLKLKGYRLEKAIKYIRGKETPIVCYTYQDCCF